MKTVFMRDAMSPHRASDVVETLVLYPSPLLVLVLPVAPYF